MIDVLNGLPRPLPDFDTEPFWNGCREGRFLIPACTDCGRGRWPPGPMCPHCRSTAVEWRPASGRGSVYSWVVVVHPTLDALVDQVPYVVGLIELDEQVRVVGNLAGISPDAVTAGLPVELYFEPPGDDGIPIPNFRVTTKTPR